MAKPEETEDSFSSVIIGRDVPISRVVSLSEEDEILKKIRRFKDAQASYLMSALPELEELHKDSGLPPRDFIDANSAKIEELKQANPDVDLTEFQATEKEFYANLHRDHGFTKVSWSENQLGEKVSIIQVAGQEVGLKETRSTNGDFTFRNVDLAIEEPLPGRLDLSLAVLDKDGNRIPQNEAVYFTAHYDQDGKLAEMSMPKPIKFLNEGKDSPIIIEQNGKEYTLPINRGQYERMQKQILINKGLEQNLGVAHDLVSTSHSKAEEKQPVVEEPVDKRPTSVEQVIKAVKNAWQNVKKLFTRARGSETPTAELLPAPSSTPTGADTPAVTHTTTTPERPPPPPPPPPRLETRESTKDNFEAIKAAIRKNKEGKGGLDETKRSEASKAQYKARKKAKEEVISR
jgi:hypothetical protein